MQRRKDLLRPVDDKSDNQPEGDKEQCGGKEFIAGKATNRQHCAYDIPDMHERNRELLVEQKDLK